MPEMKSKWFRSNGVYMRYVPEMLWASTLLSAETLAILPAQEMGKNGVTSTGSS